MAIRKVNTNSYELQPAGHYVLELESLKQKTITVKSSGKTFQIEEFKFHVEHCSVDYIDETLTVGMFKSQAGDLLRSLGADEVSPGQFVIDDDKIVGKNIECELVHMEVNGKLKETLIEIKPFVRDAPKVEWPE